MIQKVIPDDPGGAAERLRGPALHLRAPRTAASSSPSASGAREGCATCRAVNGRRHLRPGAHVPVPDPGPASGRPADGLGPSAMPDGRRSRRTGSSASSGPTRRTTTSPHGLSVEGRRCAQRRPGADRQRLRARRAPRVRAPQPLRPLRHRQLRGGLPEPAPLPVRRPRGRAPTSPDSTAARQRRRRHRLAAGDRSCRSADCRCCCTSRARPTTVPDPDRAATVEDTADTPVPLLHDVPVRRTRPADRPSHRRPATDDAPRPATPADLAPRAGRHASFLDHLEQTADWEDMLVVDIEPGDGTSAPRAYASWNSVIPGALRDWQPGGDPLPDLVNAPGVWRGRIRVPAAARSILGENAALVLTVRGHG